MKKRIKAAVVEDEPNSLEFILGIIEIFFPSIQIAGFSENLKTGLTIINKHKPDLIFADIELPDGNGLRFPEMISEMNPDYHPIFIFISANESYRKMIDPQNSYFLTKPVQIKLLEKIIEQISNKLIQAN